MNKKFFNKQNLIFQLRFVIDNYVSSVNNPEFDNTCAFIAVLEKIIDKFDND